MASEAWFLDVSTRMLSEQLGVWVSRLGKPHHQQEQAPSNWLGTQQNKEGRRPQVFFLLFNLLRKQLGSMPIVFFFFSSIFFLKIYLFI